MNIEEVDEPFMDVSESIRHLSMHLMLELKYCDNGIPDGLLSALNCMFQSILPSALHLVDMHAVACVQSPSGRMIYKVILTLNFMNFQ